MNKVLTFYVRIKGLEDKIWRKIEIKESDTLADFSYFILASFELFSNEFFTITYDNNKYDSTSCLFDNDDYKSIMSIKLKDINYDINKIIILDYNFNSKITFIINYIGNKNVKDNDYPKIIDGFGKGAIDYVDGEELKQIVDETDKLGCPNYSITIVNEDGDEEEKIFDYNDFDLDTNNSLSRCNVEFIKDEYESMDLLNFIRIIKENKVYFYKSDIKNIVNPYDYLKKYIPDNYDELSDEEIKKLNIPDYEELNIYMLPEYKEINHKDIMTLYVKRKVENKEVRRNLFYTLRNYDYMDKFYNNLRKYGLFKDYLDYSNYYYKDIIDNWIERNNIEGI